MIPPSPRFLSSLAGCILLLGGILLPGQANAEVQYSVRGKTYDYVKAATFVSGVGFRLRKVRQGSFGAPAINDKGNVAYACVMSGKGLGVFRNNSIILRSNGKYHGATLALQAGFIVADTFLPAQLNNDSKSKSESGYMYRFGLNVALNNKNRIAFTGQLFYKLISGLNGDKPTTSDTDTAVYGLCVPITSKANSYRNVGLESFLSYDESVLTDSISLNLQNATIYSADFFITDTKSVPGIAFAAPKNRSVIATTEATVIGLPYFTTFQSLSSPVIASNNVAFLIADISDAGDAFDGIWQGNNPNLQPVVVKDTNAPAGGTFTSFNTPIGPAHNGSTCAFIANVSNGSGSAGVYRVQRNGNKGVRIAYLGQTAPGFGGSSLGSFTQFDQAASNNNGQVAFQASAPGKRGISHSGVWVSDENGENLQLLVMEGQTITVGKTDKTVTSFAFNAINGFNRKGQIAFTATFSDRTSAVIIATPSIL